MRISFKQFLSEEDDEDRAHGDVAAAAAEYVKHCSQFADVTRPLFRLTGRNNTLRTRVPRQRLRASLGGSARQQEYVFSQPAWAGYPKRRMSIFCSTTTEFEVGDADDDGSNLLCIYPFDGVKIAMLDDNDLNKMSIFRGRGMPYIQIDGLFEMVLEAMMFFRGTDFYDRLPSHMDVEDRIRAIKKVFTRNGKFDSEANGDDELADKYAESEQDGDGHAKLVRVIATAVPEMLTPEAWGAKLVTSGELDLPGKTRECWFSGKYLSVPYQHFIEFKAEVARIQKEKKK